MSELRDALSQAAQANLLLVALDFDGVMAPLVDNPYESRALPESLSAVDFLDRLPRTWTAFITGRNLDNLRSVVTPPRNTLLYGAHGAEVSVPDAADVPDAAVPGSGDDLSTRELRVLDVIDTAHEELDTHLNHTGISGMWLERKPLGRAFHTREVEPEGAEIVRRALDELSAELDDVRIVHGHDIVEFSVRSTTKGDAIDQLMQTTRADAAIYMGDDTTDEDAFRHLNRYPGGLTVKVGPGRTEARFRAEDPREVSRALAHLASAREREVSREA